MMGFSSSVPFGGLQGFGKGLVPSYSNGNDSYFSRQKNFMLFEIVTPQPSPPLGPPPRQFRNGVEVFDLVDELEAESVAAARHHRANPHRLGSDMCNAPSAAGEGAESLYLRIYTGYQWQCVEYARRWLLCHKGLLLPDTPNAANVFNMTHVEDVTSRSDRRCALGGGKGAQNHNYVRMVRVENGSDQPPVVGALIVWPANRAAPFGHIGVVVEVTESFIRIADQNQHFHDWRDRHYSAQLPLLVRSSSSRGGGSSSSLSWSVTDRAYGQPWNPLGWMVFPDVGELPVVLPSTPARPAGSAVSAEGNDGCICLDWSRRYLAEAVPGTRGKRNATKTIQQLPPAVRHISSLPQGQ